MAKQLAMGIDLGTSNSCVAIVEDGIPKVIAADSAAPTSPMSAQTAGRTCRSDTAEVSHSAGLDASHALRQRVRALRHRVRARRPGAASASSTTPADASSASARALRSVAS